MYVHVSTDDIFQHLRSDLRNHLTYGGVRAVVEYYEQLECDTDAPIEYDESIFYSWETGDTCAEILEEYDDLTFEEIKKDYEEVLERACREYLEDHGTLLEMRGGGYLWQE